MQQSTVTFLWHDYETFGLNTRRDRPAQFAAVRTDDQLLVIEPEMCLYCRPTMDYLPDPQSIQITGILPQQCEAQGLPEAHFARRIHQEMTRPETISVGYNSMRFDDEVSRFLFWRNFLDAYEREYKDGCSRFDLFPLVLATWALRPEGIEWPLNDEGRVSFRLEKLSAANGLVHEKAHDALSDVYATIAMARLIRQKQPRLWDYALTLRNKNHVRDMIEKARTSTPLLWVSMTFGQKAGYMKFVAPIGTMPGQPNKILMWDLQHDPSELMRLTAEDVRERLFKSEKMLPEGVKPLPIHVCAINQAPFLVQHLGVLRDERAQAFGLDKALALKHFEMMQPMTAPLTGLWLEVFGERDEGEAVDVDESLYGGGFFGFDDKRKCQWIAKQEGERLAWLVESGRAAFDDERLPEMLFRYRARNWPETLNEREQELWKRFCHDRLMQGAGGAMTLEAFAEKIEAMAETDDFDERTEELCGALYDWCERVSNALDD